MCPADVLVFGSGAFVRSLNENVGEAYNFFANNWAPGDEIFLFGFSRGAYTARALAGFICQVGLLEARFMDEFPAVYTAFQSNTDGKAFKDTQWAKEDKDVYSRMVQKDVGIKSIGVWDTVGSLGLPETVSQGRQIGTRSTDSTTQSLMQVRSFIRL